MSESMSTSQDVLDLLREMTGQSLLLSEAIAREAGLRPADLEVLGIIEQHGPMTAGRLGAATGLSPAAVTGLIDRLERAGVAERRADAADRRRVLVRVSPGAARVAELYHDLEIAARELVARRSQAELRAIAAFLRDMHALAVEHVARLERASPETG
jgi:DNA-binding MarR family transcriptional regulator